MKLDPVLLNMACSWSMKAYNENNPDTIKIENKWTSTTVFIIKRKSVDIIAFRGSQQAADWIFNASAIPVPYAGRFCHGGFALAHASVWGQVKKHIDYKKRTLICAHSLGGALSELTAAKLNKKHPNLSLITFGKPNVFFKGFKRPMKLDDQISCVMADDIVAKIPRIMFGPSSSQTMLYFANSGKSFINPKKEQKDGGISDAISDHFMENYKGRLKKFIKEQKNETIDT